MPRLPRAPLPTATHGPQVTQRPLHPRAWRALARGHARTGNVDALHPAQPTTSRSSTGPPEPCVHHLNPDPSPQPDPSPHPGSSVTLRLIQTRSLGRVIVSPHVRQSWCTPTLTPAGFCTTGSEGPARCRTALPLRTQGGAQCWPLPHAPKHEGGHRAGPRGRPRGRPRQTQ